MSNYYKQTILPPMKQVPAVNISLTYSDNCNLLTYSDNCNLLREDIFKDLPFKDRIKQTMLVLQVHRPVGDVVLYRSTDPNVGSWICTMAIINVGAGFSSRYTIGMVAYPVLFLDKKDVCKDDKLIYSRETETRRNLHLTPVEPHHLTEKVITCYFDKTRPPFLIRPHGNDIMLLEGILIGTTIEDHPHDERLDVIISKLIENCDDAVVLITEDLIKNDEHVLNHGFVPLLSGETVEALETTMHNVVNANILKHYK